MRCSADHLNQVGRHNAISRLRILVFSTRILAPLYPIMHVPLIPTLHSGGAANELGSMGGHDTEPQLPGR